MTLTQVSPLRRHVGRPDRLGIWSAARIKRRGRVVDLITPDDLIPRPHELVLRNGTPDTIAGWKALAEGLLTNQSCVFHRNLEISSRYAWIYKHLPACKWAGMAAFASHHVRLALSPFRLDTDRAGYADIPHSLDRPLLMEDVNTIRATNNAIFDDIFWVHLAYASAEDGIERLRVLLGADRNYAPVLSGFEAIDQGRRVLEDGTPSADARRAADELIWEASNPCVLPQPVPVDAVPASPDGS